MNATDLRNLFIFVAVLIAVGGAFVLYQSYNHPTNYVAANEVLRANMATPQTDLHSQVIYEKDHAEEWEAANSGDRAKAFPAWGKILHRFRFNVIGSGSRAAEEGLKESEAWWGKISGDKSLDYRLIKAAVLSRLNRQGGVWDAVRHVLDTAATNDELNKTLLDNGY